MIQEEQRYNPLDSDRYAAARTQAFVFLPLSPIRSFEKLVALSMSCWVRFWWPSEAGKMKR